MKKNTLLKNSIFISLALAALFSGCTKKSSVSEERAKEVVVYAYDSFAGEWGPGPELAKKFEESTGLRLTIVDCGDAVQVFNRAYLEKDNVQADVIIGIDNNLSQKAIESGILDQYVPKAVSEVVPPYIIENLAGGKYLTPYDFSHFAMIYDTESSVPAPTSLEDLAKPEYAGKIILMDPRTSTPGLGFLSWTVAVFGGKTEDYWKSLKKNVLAMTPGWSAGWGMFLKGEAPLCISYTTSPAYNVEYENTTRYAALVFDEGHVMQVEGYGLLKNAPNKEGAKKFMDYFISEEAQNLLPLTQWMFPANKNAVIPESYNIGAPVPKTTLKSDAAKTDSMLHVIND